MHGTFFILEQLISSIDRILLTAATLVFQPSIIAIDSSSAVVN